MNNPVDLKYSKSDEWIKVDGAIAVIGVTDFAQSQLSDVVFLEILVSVGDEVKKGTLGVTVESVKAAADVNLPVSGKVVEINENLTSTPEKVNTDPYGKAWMVKLQLSNPSELDTLMNSDRYEAYCQERDH
jgi:glycine cleavage system H protein